MWKILPAAFAATLALAFAAAVPAAAQICPTAPAGTNNNQCASTAFVQGAISGGGGLPVSANTVLAGPASGPTAVPTFRALVGADLPNPSASTLGGIQSYGAISHQWLDSISTLGVPHSSQPSFSDLLGSNTCAQLPALTGDATSSSGSCSTNVGKVQGLAYKSGATYSNGQVPTWNSGNSQFEPGNGANIYVANNEAALTALAAGAYNAVWLAGYYNVGDGGEGLFIWQSSCPGTPDAGVYISPNVGSGCWQRSVYSTQPNVRWWGAKCDVTGSDGSKTGTNDAVALQAAINWAQSQGAGIIHLPRGTQCGTQSNLQISKSDVGIEAEGASWGLNKTSYSNGNCGAYLVALSPFSGGVGATKTGKGDILDIYNSSFGANTAPLSGNVLKGVCFDGNNLAGTGLLVSSVIHGKFESLWFKNFGNSTFQVPLWISVSSIWNGGNGFTGISCGTQFNDFRNISIETINNTSGHALRLDAYNATGGGQANCNPSLNHFENIDIDMAGSAGTGTQRAIVLQGVDNDEWHNVRANSAGSVNDLAVDFECNMYGTAGSFCTGNELFDHYSGALISANVSGILSIQLKNLDNGNGVPTPSCASGSVMHWEWESGAKGNCPSTVSTVTALGCAAVSSGGYSGAKFIVTDSAASPAYLGTPTGGGSTVVTLSCNGTAWKNE